MADPRSKLYPRRLLIPVTEAQAAEWRRAAQALGVSVSALVRRAVDDRVRAVAARRPATG